MLFFVFCWVVKEIFIYGESHFYNSFDLTACVINFQIFFYLVSHTPTDIMPVINFCSPPFFFWFEKHILVLFFGNRIGILFQFQHSIENDILWKESSKNRYDYMNQIDLWRFKDENHHPKKKKKTKHFEFLLFFFHSHSLLFSSIKSIDRFYNL